MSFERAPAEPRSTLAHTTSAPVAVPSADFQRLLDPHLLALHAIARGIVASDDLAADAVQETLVCCWNTECAPPDLRGWLVRTVVHKCLHLLRSQQRRTRHEERASSARDESCPLCDPGHLAEELEQREELERALAELSEELRTVFLLRSEHDLDYAAIAARLKVPIGTVRSRLCRARRALAERLVPGGLDGR